MSQIAENQGQSEAGRDARAGWSKRCRRCRAVVLADQADDVILRCEHCTPERLAELTRRPLWFQGPWDIDARINLRGAELARRLQESRSVRQGPWVDPSTGAATWAS